MTDFETVTYRQCPACGGYGWVHPAELGLDPSRDPDDVFSPFAKSRCPECRDGQIMLASEEDGEQGE